MPTPADADETDHVLSLLSIGFRLCLQISKTGEQKLNRGERNRHFLRPYAGMAKLAIAPRCQRGECGFKSRCLLQSNISRFSSAGRAPALQAEGPRFDPWNRDENSFPIRLGESTPLTRRPKGKMFDVPISGICGHGVIGSIPVFQTGGAGSFPVVHFFPAVIAQWKRSCFVNSRFPVQVRLTALRVKLERYHGGPISREHGFKSRTRYFIAP